MEAQPFGFYKSLRVGALRSTALLEEEEEELYLR